MDVVDRHQEPPPRRPLLEDRPHLDQEPQVAGIRTATVRMTATLRRGSRTWRTWHDPFGGEPALVGRVERFGGEPRLAAACRPRQDHAGGVRSIEGLLDESELFGSTDEGPSPSHTRSLGPATEGLCVQRHPSK